MASGKSSAQATESFLWRTEFFPCWIKRFRSICSKWHYAGCFLTTSHTTGGNSGSPVINGSGELIGTNFDRVWEGTMSDIMFSPDRCRNIAVDIRYTLWIIDKVEGAGYLLDEMKLSSPKMWKISLMLEE
jgi:hypothetical protein